MNPLELSHFPTNHFSCAQMFVATGWSEQRDRNPGTHVVLGPVDIGTKRTEELRLRSLTGRSFCVTALSCSPPDAGVGVTPQSTDGREATYALRIHAPREGEQRAEITFQVEEADGARYPLLVPVNYLGRLVSRNP